MTGRSSLESPGRMRRLLRSGRHLLERICTAQGLDTRPIRLIKLDAEGYEPEIIAGGRQALARCRAVLIEYSPELMKAGKGP